MKSAATDSSPSIRTVHFDPKVVSHPAHPKKKLPKAGAAVNVTTAPDRYEVEHAAPHLI